MKIAILEGNKITYLWPGLDKDVMDGVYADKNRIVFVSTINNIPELFWCNLKNENVWYRIETPKGGVRFPAAEGSSIYCSVYNKGHHRIYKISDPYKKINKIDTSALSVVKKDKENSLKNVSYKKSIANVPLGTPTLSFFYQLERTDLSKYNDEIGHKISTQFAYSIKNAPGNVEFSGMVDLAFPIGYENYMNKIYPSGAVWVKFHL